MRVTASSHGQPELLPRTVSRPSTWPSRIPDTGIHCDTRYNGTRYNVVHLVLGTMDVNVDTVLHQTTQCLHTTAVLQYVVQTVTMMKYVATTDLTVMDARWVIVV